MGTRGAYGFVKGGVKKITYNHYDSYPSHLGEIIKGFLVNTSKEEIEEIFNRIILVDENSKVFEDVGEDFLNIGVSTGTDWYSYLRETQGRLDVYKDENFKYMIDNQEFLNDGLFCEWAYIYDLDKEELNIYKGYNKVEGTEDEYSVDLIKIIPYEYLSGFNMTNFEKIMNIN
ncbi:MAG: hypothetical protein DRJ01_01005 [Bacteroidetes bacterium]|nr:MAG: hypothetical protein DRJ01_01005 [Bacteroidota bacterium]